MDVRGWIPSRFVWRQGGPEVQWTLLGSKRLTDPFFEQTLAREMKHPFHHLFRRDSTPAQMVEWMQDAQTVPLRGIILHESRCGSTLMAQMLAASERNVVVSEAPPFDGVVLARQHDPAVERTTQIAWLRAMSAALGQARAGGEAASFLKLDCWHAAYAELLREAFPEVPLLFLYRDPVEVLVSHMRVPALWTLPHGMKTLGLMLDPEDWDPQRPEEYRARALKAVCEGGLLAAERLGALLVNYNELPEVMFGRVFTHLGLAADAVAGMRDRAERSAKSPQERFEPDTDRKQENATERIQAAVAQHLQPVYRRLERLRSLQMGGLVT